MLFATGIRFEVTPMLHTCFRHVLRPARDPRFGYERCGAHIDTTYNIIKDKITSQESVSKEKNKAIV